MKKNALLFSLSLFVYFQGAGIKIDRVVLASNTNPMYLDFWPLVAKAWQKMGVRPTLALIEDKENIEIDESLGDVIRFKPIKGVSPGWMAMVIRVLLPIYFEEEVSILSDIDILPLNKAYFIDYPKFCSDDSFVVYRDKVYGRSKRVSMCYNAAKGKTFKEIFKINSLDDIPALIQKWAKEYRQRFSADEFILTKYLYAWSGYEKRCVRLKDKINSKTRIDRSHWVYDPNLLKKGDFYIDSHMVRPYRKHKDKIDKLAKCIGIEMP